jgi:hypothetical protein
MTTTSFEVADGYYCSMSRQEWDFVKAESAQDRLYGDHDRGNSKPIERL